MRSKPHNSNQMPLVFYFVNDDSTIKLVQTVHTLSITLVDNFMVPSFILDCRNVNPWASLVKTSIVFVFQGRCCSCFQLKKKNLCCCWSPSQMPEEYPKWYFIKLLAFLLFICCLVYQLITWT